MKNWIDSIMKLDLCLDACDWLATPDVAAMTFSQAWAACEREDWMLWLAERVEVDRKLVVLTACLCAREALCYVPVGEERPRIAIETAERWARGEATIEEVRIAGNAANDAYYDARYVSHVSHTASHTAVSAASHTAVSAYYAARAADAAYHAASSAAIHAQAADEAYHAACAAACAAETAAYYDEVRSASRKRFAELVRSIISAEMVEKAFWW